VRLRLGQALLRMEREPERARTLIEQARSAYAARGDEQGAAAAERALAR
jgi:hypothetical protein